MCVGIGKSVSSLFICFFFVVAVVAVIVVALSKPPTTYVYALKGG